MGRLCAQAEWSSGLSSPGPQCVRVTLTGRMQWCSVESWDVGLLYNSRGRSMKTHRLLSGEKSSGAGKMSPPYWTVRCMSQLGTHAHLYISPAQVEAK